jgi:proteic killer suppression protein
MKSWRFEKLSGRRAGQHSIRLNDQFRLVVRLESTPLKTVVIVEIVDYH